MLDDRLGCSSSSSSSPLSPITLSGANVKMVEVFSFRGTFPSGALVETVLQHYFSPSVCVSNILCTQLFFSPLLLHIQPFVFTQILCTIEKFLVLCLLCLYVFQNAFMVLNVIVWLFRDSSNFIGPNWTNSYSKMSQFAQMGLATPLNNNKINVWQPMLILWRYATN